MPKSYAPEIRRRVVNLCGAGRAPQLVVGTGALDRQDEIDVASSRGPQWRAEELSRARGRIGSSIGSPSSSRTRSRNRSDNHGVSATAATPCRQHPAVSGVFANQLLQVTDVARQPRDPVSHCPLPAVDGAGQPTALRSAG
jgi:hypothetical protein